MATIAFALSFLASVASYHWSRLCSAAFALAFGASAAYLGLAHLTPAAHALGAHEWLRLVSVVAGALGGAELLWRARHRGLRATASPSGFTRMRVGTGFVRRWVWKLRPTCVAITVDLATWQERWAIGRPDAIASLLVASSAVDGASWLWWRETGQWGPLPAVACLLYAGVCVVGFWRRGRA